jgi:hypothetical protein
VAAFNSSNAENAEKDKFYSNRLLLTLTNAYLIYLKCSQTQSIQAFIFLRVLRALRASALKPLRNYPTLNHLQTAIEMPAMTILQLDIQGMPQAWLSAEQAAVHYAARRVSWSVGEPCVVLRGGMNAQTGAQSRIAIAPIIATSGAARVNLFDCTPALTNPKLFARDRMTCAYCGGVFAAIALSREHIVPVSIGGPNEWRNVVAACRSCNHRKAARTPEQARMPLLFMPYVPSVYEDFILRSRHIRADVHAWLAARLPKGSRVQ